MSEQTSIDRRGFLRTASGTMVAAGAAGAGVFSQQGTAQAQEQEQEQAKAQAQAQSGDKPYAYQGEPNGGTFKPLEEKGIPLEKQARDWRELTNFQYDKHEVHPYTRCRIITMNGVEVAAALFKHQMHRNIQDDSLRQALAVSRRIEQQQQKKVNGLIPANEHTLEVTIGYEQVAVDLTAWLAQNEPDPYVKAALDFAMLEDFDHLYRYANILALKGNGYMTPEQIVGKLTEITPGRPTWVEHRHPKDSVRSFVDYSTASPQTIMNIMTIVAGEQQTMNFYMNVANRAEDETLRGLYNEIGMIEEEHVTHYGSLMDPTGSWLKNAVLHELHEVYLYHSFYMQEEHPKVKQVWELHRDMEIGHLHAAVDLYKKHMGNDPAEFIPMTLPEPTIFQSNVEYVREVLEKTVQLTAKEKGYVDVNTLSEDDRYFQWREEVNGEWIPSVEAVKAHFEAKGRDYRYETAPHPIDAYRQREAPELPKKYEI